MCGGPSVRLWGRPGGVVPGRAARPGRPAPWRLANTGRSRSRTAYLHVNFRAISPIGHELRVTARVDRIEGRKRFLTGAIHHHGTLTADAEGLFVELRPGQG
jgi:acyl-CoA thioesterase FadM